jgi:hypothetical protein
LTNGVIASRIARIASLRLTLLRERPEPPADPQVLDRPLAHEQLEAGGEWDSEDQVGVYAHVEEQAGHHPDADESKDLNPAPNKA